MDFGMLPIVTYTGYADFPRNRVSCVLSEERMIGMTVAPGRCSSRVVYHNIISTWTVLTYENEPALPTTSHQCASRYTHGICAHSQCSGAQGHRPSHARTRDLHKESEYIARHHGSRAGACHLL